MNELFVGVLIGASLIPLYSITKHFYNDWKVNNKVKRYERLWKGVPKHTRTITSKHDLWKWSQHPIIIDGEVYYRPFYSPYKWHVSEEIVCLIRVSDNKDVILRLEERYMSKVASVIDNGKYLRCNQWSVVLEVY